jgi:hypothetical protein
MGTVTGQGGARSSHSSHSVRYARALATCFCLNVKKLWDVGKSDREKQSEPAVHNLAVAFVQIFNIHQRILFQLQAHLLSHQR